MWHRIVLDEMQEVRSSTTELARKCERLSGGRRWMVSGAQLPARQDLDAQMMTSYSMSDNGELMSDDDQRMGESGQRMSAPDSLICEIGQPRSEDG